MTHTTKNEVKRADYLLSSFSRSFWKGGDGGQRLLTTGMPLANKSFLRNLAELMLGD